MTPSPSNTEESSAQKLLQSGKELFARKGFDGASVKEIADAAGVNISLVSYHFGGKEGLYRACIEAVGKDIHSRVESILSPAKTIGDFRDRIEKLIESMILHYIEEPDSVRVLHRECDLEANEHTEDIFKGTLLKVFEKMIQFIEDGKKKGFMRADLDSMAIASFIAGTVGRLVHMDPVGKKHFGVTLHDETYRNTILRNLSEVYFHGIFPLEDRKN